MSPTKAELRQAILSQAGVLKEQPAVMFGPDGAALPVLVRELTGQQSREFEVAVATQAPNPLGYLLTMCICDPSTREPIFEAADRETLEQLGMSVLKPLIEISQQLSGLSDKDIAEAKQQLLANARPNGSS